MVSDMVPIYKGMLLEYGYVHPALSVFYASSFPRWVAKIGTTASKVVKYKGIEVGIAETESREDGLYVKYMEITNPELAGMIERYIDEGKLYFGGYYLKPKLHIDTDGYRRVDSCDFDHVILTLGGVNPKYKVLKED